MKRFLNPRVFFSLALLWLVARILVSTLQITIIGTHDLPFLPVAISALLMAYLLGFGNWSEHRAGMFLSSIHMVLILVVTTRTGPALWQILTHLLPLPLRILSAWISRQSVDLSFFKIQFEVILHYLEIFRIGIVTGLQGEGMTLIELGWQAALFVVCAWAGWWSSRRNSILLALLPSLGLQVFLLNYAKRQEGLYLQIAVFILIFLMSLHQKWSLSKSESKAQNKVRTETYVTIFGLAALLATAAGSAPIIPEPIPPTKTPKPQPQQVIEKPIKKEVAQYSSGPPAGLPQNHVIDEPPKSLLDVIFLASIDNNTHSLDQVDADNGPTGEVHYWRWITYDQYNGITWSSSPTTSVSYSADQTLFEYSGDGYRLVHQNIIKASTGDSHLYWTGALMNASDSIDTTWRAAPTAEDPLLHMDMLGSIIHAQQYSADSLLPEFTIDQLRAASREYPIEILQNYLSLPRNTISQRVRDLAVSLTYEAQNPYDKAKAIETYLRTYPYTLDVPPVPAGREISDYFLFELKTGYCEYYASSMIVMARTIGLPARMVIGYASDEYDPGSGQYIVREAHAHSWVEIYFPELGWVEFEPTASQPLRSQPLTPEELNPPIPLEPSHKDRSGIMYQKHGFFVKHAPVFSILLLIFALIGLCLVYLKMQGLWLSYKTIGSIYEYIYRQGRKIIPEVSPNATPSLFAEYLKTKLTLNHQFILPAADEVDRLTLLYLKEIYTRHAVTSEEQQQAEEIWHRLFWRLLYTRLIQTFSALADRANAIIKQ